MLRLGQFGKHICSGLIAAVLPAVVVAMPAFAAAPPAAATVGFAAQPAAGQPQALIGNGYFTLALKPGQSKTVRIAVQNTGTQPLRLSDYPVDAAQMATGGIDFSALHQQLKAVGSWIAVKPASLTLAPGEARRVTATITMPRNARAGDHVGGVALENNSVQSKGAGSHLLLDVHYRRTIAILASVPGAKSTTAQILGATLSPEPAGSRAVIGVRNTGNVLIKGTGTVELLGGKGVVRRVPFTVDTILPAATAQIPVSLPDLTLQPGRYGLRVEVLSARNVALAAWHGSAGYMLPARTSPSAQAKSMVLQPAQPATQLPADRDAHGDAAAAAQSTPVALLGGIAALVVVLCAGLLVVARRRSATRRA